VPALPNERWERFCELRAQGIRQGQAAEMVGFKHPDVEAARLIKRPDVQKRIAEIQPMVDAKRSELMTSMVMPTRAEVLNELWATVKEAKTAQDRPSTLRGLELIGKELGMFVQRADIKVSSPLDGLNAEMLRRFLAAVEVEDGDDQAIEGEAEPVLAIEQASEHA
jgi:hypothetical protein